MKQYKRKHKKYPHFCEFGNSLVSLNGYKANRCKKCSKRKNKNIIININGIIYEINSYHQLYNIRKAMKARCYHAKKADYKNYQGKGIKICDDWLNNPESFYLWALLNGWKTDLTIDRIDSDKNYEPDNCRFISRSENTQRSHLQFPKLGIYNSNSKLEIKEILIIRQLLEESKKISDIANLFNVSRVTISRIKNNESYRNIK